MNSSCARFTPVLGLILVVAPARLCRSADFIDTFDGYADPSALSTAAWFLISGTNNPTTVSPDFAINNNQNIIKITGINDAGSLFTSAHIFLEHDYWTGAPGDGGNDPNNFGRGDAMIYTYKHLTQIGATAIDMNGAYVSVDYANGNQFNGGPSFWFAFKLANGGWWIYETGKLGHTTAQVTHALLSTDPMDNTFTFIPMIVEPGNSFNPDVRLIPNDSLTRELTTQELSRVTGVGIYSFPTYDTGPARFDNFSITNFTPIIAPRGDLNCDFVVNTADVAHFVQAIINPAAYASTHALCYASHADINGDGLIDGADVQPFIACVLSGGCP